MDSLLAMGFEEVTAEAALSATGGDVNAALELLLSGSDIPTQVVNFSSHNHISLH